MESFFLRRLRADEWEHEARLIATSTNAWYAAQGKPAIFPGSSADCQVFCQVYEALDPGCCLVVEETKTGTLVASCFYHPRSTHVSVGIVNTDPDYFGSGLARRMLTEVIALAEREGKPVRLVSSAMNLDSFSLYTRAGFVPRQVFHDLVLPDPTRLPETDARVRPVALDDLDALVALERELVGLERRQDFAYFIQNALGIWSGSVWEDAGKLDGFLFAVSHPASNLIGPGVARNAAIAAALIAQERRKHPANPVILVPADASELVRTLYCWGGRNVEVHLAQVRGAWQPPKGIVFPTFLPESG